MPTLNRILPLPPRFVDRVNRETGKAQPFEQFWFNERDGRVLVTPAKLKFEWHSDERVYRSVILDAETGEVLSIGFDKFGNYGEENQFGDHMRQLEQDLQAGRVRWLEKFDGSLCIRSVIDGDVVFRTRGTHDGGDFGPHMRQVAKAKYPILLDPTFKPDESMMFEFVSQDPAFQIVVRYDESDLVYLGDRSHRTLEFGRWEDIERTASEYGLNLVKSYELPGDIEGVLSAVREWKGKEGVVARCGDDQVFVKVKSASYLLLHRLRTQLTAKGVREMCEREGVESLEEFQDQIKETGADWEMVKDTEPIVRTYLDTSERVRERFADLQSASADAQIRFADEPKRYATEFAKGLDRDERAAAFALRARAVGAEERLRSTDPERLAALRAHVVDVERKLTNESDAVLDRLQRQQLEITRLRPQAEPSVDQRRQLKELKRAIEVAAYERSVDGSAEPSAEELRLTAERDRFLEEIRPPAEITQQFRALEASIAADTVVRARISDGTAFEETIVGESEGDRELARDLRLLNSAFEQLRSSALDGVFERLAANESTATIDED